MPYDKNGKYYRKPVYKIEKIKKDLPLKKKRRFSFFIFRFYTLGLISPLVLISLLTFSIYYLSEYYRSLYYVFPSALSVIIYSFSVSIIYGFITKRFHKFQLKKYIEQGGKTPPIEITRLAIIWWIVNLLIAGLIVGLFIFFLWSIIIMIEFLLETLESIFNFFSR